MGEMTFSGAMIALYLPTSLQEQLAAPGGERAEDLHVTLVFLGEADKLRLGQVKRLQEIVESIAKSFSPLEASISGVGRFVAADADVGEPFYVSVDSPTLPALREALTRALSANGLPYARNHGFSPHVTISYLTPGTPPPAVVIPEDAFVFDRLTLAIASTYQHFPLEGTMRSTARIAEPVVAVGRPFADYNDFGSCVAANKGQKDPEAYCAAIHKKATGKYPGEMAKKKRSELGIIELDDDALAMIARALESDPDVERSDDDHVDLTERFTDTYTMALREALKHTVTEDEFNTAVRYARAKAGGYASAVSKQQKRESENESDAVAKLVMGEPLKALSVSELSALERRLPLSV